MAPENPPHQPVHRKNLSSSFAPSQASQARSSAGGDDAQDQRDLKTQILEALDTIGGLLVAFENRIGEEDDKGTLKAKVVGIMTDSFIASMLSVLSKFSRVAGSMARSLEQGDGLKRIQKQMQEQSVQKGSVDLQSEISQEKDADQNHKTIKQL